MRTVRKQAVGCCVALSFLFQWGCKNNDGQRDRNVDNMTPSLAAETEALKEAYAAFNRNDIAGTVKALDPQIEWIEPAEFPGGGTYHGHAGVQAYLSQSRAPWAEGSSEPERFIVAGDKIIVFVHARVRLRDSEEWHERRLADVFTFRNGKAIRMRAFADRGQALEWAGVNGSGAN
jgi:uncharacterized protein